MAKVDAVSGQLPRYVHPGAWWGWALCLGTASTRTTNPLILLLITAVAGFVVAARRPVQDFYGATGLRSFGFFLRLGLLVLVIRLVFEVIFGDGLPGYVLLRLPSVPLPSWLTGLRIGGPVTGQGLVSATYAGLQLAVLLAVVGAANALASPRRLLRALPGALYELGVAVTVALSFAPSLVGSAQRVRRARRLRGLPDRGLRSFAGVALPVLEDALERSIALAAAMDSRGFGRRGAVSGRRSAVIGGAVVAGLMMVAASAYGLLDTTSPAAAGLPLLVAGAVVAGSAVLLGGRTASRSRYRPDPWSRPEWITVASGLAVVVGVVLAGRWQAGSLHPSVYPLATPTLPWPALLGALLGLAPAWCTPQPPPPRHRGRDTDRGATLTGAVR
jgi:energy-coupling factor transport system permease protein